MIISIFKIFLKFSIGDQVIINHGLSDFAHIKLHKLRHTYNPLRDEEGHHYEYHEDHESEHGRHAQYALVQIKKFPMKDIFSKFAHIYMRRSYKRCSIKKAVLKILQYSQENTCVGVSALQIY